MTCAALLTPFPFVFFASFSQPYSRSFKPFHSFRAICWPKCLLLNSSGQRLTIPLLLMLKPAQFCSALLCCCVRPGGSTQAGMEQELLPSRSAAFPQASSRVSVLIGVHAGRCLPDDIVVDSIAGQIGANMVAGKTGMLNMKIPTRLLLQPQSSRLRLFPLQQCPPRRWSRNRTFKSPHLKSQLLLVPFLPK